MMAVLSYDLHEYEQLIYLQSFAAAVTNSSTSRQISTGGGGLPGTTARCLSSTLLNNKRIQVK